MSFSRNSIKSKETKRLLDLTKAKDAYKIIYESFSYKEREELEDLVEEIENPIVKADVIYLISLFKQKKSSKVLYKVKKCKEMVIKNEVIHATNMIRDIKSFNSCSAPSLKLANPLILQNSLPNLIEFIEEETRVDTLLLI